MYLEKLEECINPVKKPNRNKKAQTHGNITVDAREGTQKVRERFHWLLPLEIKKCK